MAGRSGGRGGGNDSPDSVRRWKEDLSYVLSSLTARQKFRAFLKSRGLEKGLNLLDVWEKCDEFLTQFQIPEHHSQER